MKITPLQNYYYSPEDSPYLDKKSDLKEEILHDLDLKIEISDSQMVECPRTGRTKQTCGFDGPCMTDACYLTRRRC